MKEFDPERNELFFASTDFKKEDREKEVEYNKRLDGLAKPDGSTSVWCFVKRFEDVVREALTELV